jgi:alcohol dehydrogenase
MLFETVAAGQIDPTRLITHRFTLAEGGKACETFGNATETGALKVTIVT